MEQQGSATPTAVDEQLLEDDAEKELHQASAAVAAQVEAADGRRDHRAALLAIASLRPHVDRFFDNVMVLADDSARRTNRLAILASIAALYSDRADFAEIVVEGKP